MRSLRIVRKPLAALLTAVVTGCYTYTPVDPGSPDAGSTVRVTYEVERGSGDGSGDLGMSRRMTGRLLEVGADSLVLTTPVVQTLRDGTTTHAEDQVSIPRSAVRQVERRDTDLLKSAGLVTAGAVGAGLAILAITGAVDSESGDTPPDDIDGPGQALLPLFGIRIP